MEQFTPRFNKREVVVRLPKTDNAFERTDEITAEVVYIGKNAINYQVGDLILFDKKVGRELNFFNDNLWKIENEDYIICKLERVEYGDSV